MDDAAILEIMTVIDLFSGFSNLMKGLDTERDDKHGMAAERNLNVVSILLFVYKLKGNQRDPYGMA